jgi:hypothetical protein
MKNNVEKLHDTCTFSRLDIMTGLRVCKIEPPATLYEWKKTILYKKSGTSLFD